MGPDGRGELTLGQIHQANLFYSLSLVLLTWYNGLIYKLEQYMVIMTRQPQILVVHQSLLPQIIPAYKSSLLAGNMSFEKKLLKVALKF